MNTEKSNLHICKQNIFNMRLYAFTLVELIIVITILAILRTIGFMSFQSYTSDARDINRITTIGEIKKGLELYSVKNSKYPFPEGNVILSGSINTQVLTYVGELGDNISKIIKFTNIPKDPLTNTNYTYGTTSDYKYYQISSILEGSTAYNNITNTIYADNQIAKVEGNYPGFLKYSSGSELFIANIPSLIFNNTGSVTDLLSETTYYVVNNKSNLPYNTKGIKDTSIQKISGNALMKEITKSEEASLTGVNITNLKKENFETIFTGAILKSFNISGLDLTENNNIVYNIKNSILGNSSNKNNNGTENEITCETGYTKVGNECLANYKQLNTIYTGARNKEVRFTLASGKYFIGDIKNWVATSLPKNLKLPLGDLDFTIGGLNSGETFEVNILADKLIGAFTFFKKSNLNKWVNITKRITFVDTPSYMNYSSSGVIISFDLTDGGVFDNDKLADGIFNNPNSCGPGYYFDGIDANGVVIRTACPTGTYNPLTNQTSSNACLPYTMEDGYMPIDYLGIYSTTGVVGKSICEAGYYCSSGTKNICPTGTTSNTGASLSSQCY